MTEDNSYPIAVEDLVDMGNKLFPGKIDRMTN